MNIETMTVPKKEAFEAIEHYRLAVKERHDAEDKAILKGYEEIIKGNEILNIRDVFREVECDEAGRPKLAVSGAQYKQVWCHVGSDHCRFGWVMYNLNDWRREMSIAQGNSLRVPLPHDPRRWMNVGHRLLTTMVPSIPPQFRPKRILKSHYILWEVEEWNHEPPLDPMLLRHLGGALYAVLAVWDLTLIERAVLSETRRPS